MQPTPSEIDLKKCPKCQNPRTQVEVMCPYCGVVYKHFIDRKNQASQTSKANKTASQTPKKPLLKQTARSNQRRESLSSLPKMKSYNLSSHKRETFFKILAETLQAGLTFSEFTHGPAIQLLPLQFGKQLQKLATQGYPISQTLNALGILEPAALAILKAGEEHGTLPTSLELLSQRLVRQRKARKKLLKRLIYPAFLLISYTFTQPLGTLIIKGPFAYFQQLSSSLFFLSILFVFFFFLLPRIPTNHIFLQYYRLITSYIPGLRQIQKHRSLTIFCETLGSCLRSGLSIQPALQLSTAAASHPAFENKAEQLLQDIEQGAKLSQALQRMNVFSKEALILLAHGEQIGKLDEVLKNLASEHDRKTQTTTTIVFSGTAAIVTISIVIYLVFSITAQWQKQYKSIDKQMQQILQPYK